MHFYSFQYEQFRINTYGVKSEGNIVSFRQRLKTYFFNAAYPP